MASKTTTSTPVLGLLDRLRSSARTGRRLHLEPDQARVLLDDEIYGALTKLEAEEIRNACPGDFANDIRSASTGSGSDPESGPGRFAGWNEGQMDAASRGASLLLREEAARTTRRKKH